MIFIIIAQGAAILRHEVLSPKKFKLVKERASSIFVGPPTLIGYGFAAP